MICFLHTDIYAWFFSVGVILKRKLQRVPKSRCWFVGFSDSNAVDKANKFSEKWPSDLIVGKHDCRHYTNGKKEK